MKTFQRFFGYCLRNHYFCGELHIAKASVLINCFPIDIRLEEIRITVSHPRVGALMRPLLVCFCYSEVQRVRWNRFFFYLLNLIAMNAFDLFFVLGPAVKSLFQIGMLPQDEDFVELTEEEKNQYLAQNPFTDEKIFRLEILTGDDRFKDNVICMTESEKMNLLQAVGVIDDYGKDRTFKNTEEKLHYAASRLPDVFSKGSRFEMNELK